MSGEGPRWVIVARPLGAATLADCECVGPFVAPDIAHEYGAAQFKERGWPWKALLVKSPPEGTPTPHILCLYLN